MQEYLTLKKHKRFGNVRIIHEENRIVVRLYQTDIVVLSESGVRLNTNGWTTPTTKKAMNNALRQLKAPLHVYQSKGKWFVGFAKSGYQLPYKDGMNIAIKNRFNLLKTLKVA